MAPYGAVVLACLFGCVSTQQIRDPCGDTTCDRAGYECRLVRVSCREGSLCPPQPICIPRQASTSRCSYGLEVLQQTRDQVYSTLDCTYQRCPDSSQCDFNPDQSVCCWTPFQVTTMATRRPPPTTKAPSPPAPAIGLQGYCAKKFPLPTLFCQWMVPECRGDSDCMAGSKCCYTEKCGRKGCLLARFQQECSFLDKILGLC